MLVTVTGFFWFLLCRRGFVCTFTFLLQSMLFGFNPGISTYADNVYYVKNRIPMPLVEPGMHGYVHIELISGYSVVRIDDIQWF
jgi:hypothetical protein